MNTTKVRKSASVVLASTLVDGSRDFLRRLRDADDPHALVEMEAPQDLLMAYGQADDEQRADLLALVSPEQFHSMVDLYGWSGHAVSMERIAEFIAPLVSTGLGGAIRALDSLEDEIRTLLLRHYVIVHQREHLDDDEPLVPDTSAFIPTPDGYYFIEIPDEEMCPQVVRQLLDGLVFKPFEDYHRELEAIRYDLTSALEEDALRWRNGRLSDMGFGTREEGLRLLSPLDPEMLRDRLQRSSGVQPLPDPQPLPTLYRKTFSQNEFLEAVLRALRDSTDPVVMKRAEQIPAELTAMTNLFLSAIGFHQGDLSEVERGVVMARDLLVLGLEAVCTANPEAAARALSTEVPGVFLQAAMGVLAPLRNRARALRKGSLQNNGRRLDPFYHTALRCLDREIPVWWSPLDDFQTGGSAFPEPLPGEEPVIGRMDIVQRATALLEELEALDQMAPSLVRWDPGDIDREEHPVSAEILVAVFRLYCGKTASEPLSSADVDRFVTSFGSLSGEEAVSAGLRVIGSDFNVSDEGPMDPSAEPDPLRRVLLRLLYIGLERLASEPATNWLLR